MRGVGLVARGIWQGCALAAIGFDPTTHGLQLTGLLLDTCCLLLLLAPNIDTLLHFPTTCYLFLAAYRLLLLTSQATTANEKTSTLESYGC